jgi:predicted MFS family arabinose efflux permease
VRIGKPLLLITTPIGLAIGLYEGWRLAGGLVFLMAAFIGFLAFAFMTVVLTIRREKREEEQRKKEESG